MLCQIVFSSAAVLPICSSRFCLAMFLQQLEHEIARALPGYAFTLPLFRLLGSCRVGCYAACLQIAREELLSSICRMLPSEVNHTAAQVHYPTISTDMLEQVSSGIHVQGMTRMVAPCTGSWPQQGPRRPSPERHVQRSHSKEVMPCAMMPWSRAPAYFPRRSCDSGLLSNTAKAG